MDIQEFKEGIFSLRTRRFGTVAEYMIKALISVEMSGNLAYDLTDSEMNRIRDEATQKQLIEKFPIGRLGTLDEVATATCYFASQESGFTTGAILDVNGGMFMG